MFIVQDSVLQGVRLCTFAYAGCNACEIGLTTRHICTRIRAYFWSDKASHVYWRLQ